MSAFRIRRMAARPVWIVVVCLSAVCEIVSAQQAPGAVKIQVLKEHVEKEVASDGSAAELANVVVWLTPLGNSAPTSSVSRSASLPPMLTQHNKSFEPHVLVVEVGTVVQFPNRDPFFHNIFSLFDGKRFDLGLYEAGTTRSVRFDRPGVSFLFCNIHAEMSAVVVAVETPYFGMSNHSGMVMIPDVPVGRYQMHVWYERSLPENLKDLTRTVTISESRRNLDAVKVVDNPNFTSAHKNKYGQDYVPPPNPGYRSP
jgi:plastocyanin